MRRPGIVGPLVVGLGLLACTGNTAPGNDREADLEPPEPAAEVASAGSATAGVATALLYPQTMTGADLGTVPARAGRCLFRFTRVGLPVLAYGSEAVVKLNGKLVALAPDGAERYGADGVSVTVRALEGEATDGEPFPAELVFRVGDAPDELGYRGFSECGGM